MFFHRYHHGGGVGGWHAGFWLFSIGGFLLLALLVVLIVMLIRYAGSRHHASAPGGAMSGPVSGGWHARPGGEAERILGERYARGEIDEEEYQRRLWMLRDPGGGPGDGSGGGPGGPGGAPPAG
ncbi:SHOCT domain-containing protein [Kitasatospora sp. GAS204B]|uniref:SHOCT domain-containing protein n=1 Tax=unclassified Kitasatospora TaxID=2633591 RepID=UPI002474C4E7|nr:SHOCT domain-containing protein [Kitasatospora sp. GAS204B]MDH6121152.1 putative membrane protein [Kitasatospora sp. GAS204B]